MYGLRLKCYWISFPMFELWYSSIDSDDSLVPARRQASIWSNDGDISDILYIYTHTHTHIYIYIYICVTRPHGFKQQIQTLLTTRSNKFSSKKYDVLGHIKYCSNGWIVAMDGIHLNQCFVTFFESPPLYLYIRLVQIYNTVRQIANLHHMFGLMSAQVAAACHQKCYLCSVYYQSSC